MTPNSDRNAVQRDPAETDDGMSVTVTVGATDAGFYVEDDGPGIDPEHRSAVFEDGFTTTEEGTGFGLSIVETVAEAHGWSISVGESESGGARFDITL